MALQLDTFNYHGHHFPEAYVFVEYNTYRVKGVKKPKDDPQDLTAVACVYADRDTKYRGKRPIWRLWFEFKHIPKDEEDVEKQAYKALKKEAKMDGAIDVD